MRLTEDLRSLLFDDGMQRLTGIPHNRHFCQGTRIGAQG